LSILLLVEADLLYLRRYRSLDRKLPGSQILVPKCGYM